MIRPLLPDASTRGRPRTTNLRDVFDAIQYMLATGCQWRAIPKCFPPFTTVQNYFYAWRDSGVFDGMLDALRERARDLAGRSGEPTAAAIDSQSVKTTQSGGPAGVMLLLTLKGSRLRSGFTRPACRTGTVRRR